MFRPIRDELKRVEGGAMKWNDVWVTDALPHDRFLVEKLQGALGSEGRGRGRLEYAP